MALAMGIPNTSFANSPERHNKRHAYGPTEREQIRQVAPDHLHGHPPLGRRLRVEEVLDPMLQKHQASTRDTS